VPRRRAAPTLVCANWVSATPVCRVTGTKPLRIDWSTAIEAAGVGGAAALGSVLEGVVQAYAAEAARDN
jgi:hypothetical protein